MVEGGNGPIWGGFSRIESARTEIGILKRLKAKGYKRERKGNGFAREKRTEEARLPSESPNVEEILMWRSRCESKLNRRWKVGQAKGSRAIATMEPPKMASRTEPTAEEIRRRAYEIHLSRNGVRGGELEDWLQAENELCSNGHNGRRTPGA
jgi:hypothetical protein